jgi:threonine dehydrogenase-like Zn-dependent dehydrogenase
VAPQANPQDGQWVPGNAPSQALRWAVEAIAKAGTLSIIGVYPPQLDAFPVGMAMMKNLTVKMGNCNHRRYIPELVELTRTGAIDPGEILTNLEGVTDAVSAYEAFDKRQPGWLKVELEPTA